MAENKDLTLLGPLPSGRPRIFTQEIADALCERIAEGETLMSVCRDEAMPSRTTVWRWQNENPEFLERYARARELLADHEADQVRELGDCPFIPPEHKKIMVGTRQWRAERMNRRVWGGKVQHEHEHKHGASIGQGELPRALGFLAEHSEGDGEGPDDLAG